MTRNIISYIIILGIFGGLTWFVLEKGRHLPVKAVAAKLVPANTTEATASALEQFAGNFQLPLGLLLLQIVVILVVARAFGHLARKIQQPTVVGEIVAGILLGPSLLGWLWPSASQWLFPAKSLPVLMLLSQIGLVFFMFIIGMQLDTANMKRKAPSAVMISHVSIVFPFFLGVCLAYFIYGQFGQPHTSFLAFSLFMGIAMSITAFPVLARIVQERKLTGTPLGNLAITCAAADDITAWCLLALVVAISKAASISSSLLTIGFSLVFISIMLLIVKPWLKKIMERYRREGAVVPVFVLVLLSSWTAEIIGIHALFGAFLAGVTMPQNQSVKKLITEKVEDVSTLMLLPIFFTYTGLRTQIGLVWQQQLWFVFAMIMLIAVAGKLGGSAVAARCMGQPWSSALSIGVLMNTRGLMELIVLNIGYELGILSAGIFALMVLMALVTTFMTGPLLNRIYAAKAKTLPQQAVRAAS